MSLPPRQSLLPANLISLDASKIAKAELTKIAPPELLLTLALNNAELLSTKRESSPTKTAPSLLPIKLTTLLSAAKVAVDPVIFIAGPKTAPMKFIELPCIVARALSIVQDDELLKTAVAKPISKIARLLDSKSVFSKAIAPLKSVRPSVCVPAPLIFNLLTLAPSLFIPLKNSTQPPLLTISTIKPPVK